MNIYEQYNNSKISKFVLKSGKYIFWFLGFLLFFWYKMNVMFIMWVWNYMKKGEKNGRITKSSL